MIQLDLSEVEKSKNLIFQKIKPFLAIGKLSLSTYLCTPSGNPNFSFGSVCRFQSFFPIPLKKNGLFKKSTDFLNSPSVFYVMVYKFEEGIKLILYPKNSARVRSGIYAFPSISCAAVSVSYKFPLML